MKTKKLKTHKRNTHKPLEFLTDKALRKAIKAQAKSQGVPVALLLTEVITSYINRNPPTTAVHDLSAGHDLSGVRVPIQRGKEHKLMKPRYVGLNTSLEDQLIRLQCETTLSRLLLTNLCRNLLPSTNLNTMLESLLPEVQRLLEDPLLELDEYRAIKKEPVSHQVVTMDEWGV